MKGFMVNFTASGEVYVEADTESEAIQKVKSAVITNDFKERAARNIDYVNYAFIKQE